MNRDRASEEDLIARIVRAMGDGAEPTDTLADAQNALFARHHARHQMVRHAAEGLDPFDQEVITLRDHEALSYKDIERVLQIDRNVHRTGAAGILQRCRRHLERRMRRWLVQHGHGTSFVDSIS